MKDFNVNIKSLFLTAFLLFFTACSNTSKKNTDIPDIQPNEPVEEEIVWNYDLNSLPNYSKTGPEREFSEKAIELAKYNNLKICYNIESPVYFLVHGLPIINIFPAPFCGLIDSEKSVRLKNLLLAMGYRNLHLKKMEQYNQEQNGFILGVGVNDNPGFKNYFYNGHGVDEDKIYMDNVDFEGRERVTPMIFSKFNQRVFDFKTLNLDKSKKTIVYMGTVGEWEFLDKRSGSVFDETFKQLKELKSGYNVIVRPHPLLSADVLSVLRQEFITVEISQLAQFVPLYDIADLIIGTPSGATTAATSKPELPIVLLRPTKFWEFYKPTFSMDEIAQRNIGKILGPETTIVQNEHNLNLEQAVEQALNDPEHKSKIAKRREYFQRWFGCVDGYEEYRVIMEIFKNKGIEIKELEGIYRKFEEFNSRKLCL